MRGTWGALVLALAVLVAGCGGTRKLTGTGVVLVRMTEWQQPWFEEQVQRFAAARGVKLEVRAYQLVGDLEAAIAETRAKGDTPVLLKVEGRMVGPLRARNLLRSLESAVGGERVEEDMLDYLESAVSWVRRDGATWAIPRKVEVLVMAYREAALAHLAAGSPEDRARVHALLEGAGFRVDPDRRLETSPGFWDLADLAEAADGLSRVARRGQVGPRLWHRTARVEGTAVDLSCLVYPFGYSPGPLHQMPGFEPALAYSRALVRGGLARGPRDGEDVQTPMLLEGWKAGLVDFSFLQQTDAARLVGIDADAPRFVDDRDGVSFVAVPPAGDLAWPGAAAVETGAPGGGWWWGIPAGATDAALGYDLARFLTSAEVHAEECRRFGMMPIRRDLAADLVGTFPDPVVRRLMEVSFDAWIGHHPKAALEKNREIGEAYDRWRAAVAGR